MTLEVQLVYWCEYVPDELLNPLHVAGDMTDDTLIGVLPANCRDVAAAFQRQYMDDTISIEETDSSYDPEIDVRRGMTVEQFQEAAGGRFRVTDPIPIGEYQRPGMYQHLLDQKGTVA